MIEYDIVRTMQKCIETGRNDSSMKEELKNSIVDAYNSGKSLRVVGKMLNKNPQTIHNWLVEWGIPRRKRGPIIRGKGFKFRHWLADLKRRYDVDEEWYNQKHQEQGGVCAICLQPCVRERLGVDHCHTTNTVRGLLCVRCNNAIGLFRDDPAICLRASQYLSRNK